MKSSVLAIFTVVFVFAGISSGSAALRVSSISNNPSDISPPGEFIIGKFEFGATETLWISEINMQVYNAKAVDALDLMVGSTVLDTAPYDSDGFIFSGLNYKIPMNTDVVFSVRATIGPIDDIHVYFGEVVYAQLDPLSIKCRDVVGSTFVDAPHETVKAAPLTIVPEPNVIILLIGGVVATAGFRRR